MAKRTNVEIQIPPELIMEILVKLPVKSLCRLRCVSNLWCSVISDPQFVEAHRALSSCAYPRLLVLFPQVKRYKVKNSKRSYYKSKTIRAELYSVDYPQHYDHGLTQTLNYHQSIRRSAIDCSEISHPVHGLYCLDFHDRVRIWNPTTHEHLDIKTVEMGVVRPGSSKLHVTNYFGFDPVDKKHKILSISRPWRGNLKRATEGRVFVLEENCWRKLNDCPPELGEAQIQEVVCIDGVIYSTPYYRTDLVAFHVRSERFQRIPVPEEARHTGVIEFTGLATLTDIYDLPDEDEIKKCVNLWMLDDLEHRTWTRNTCVLRLGEDFRDREGMITLQGATPAGELLFAPEGFTEQPFFLLLFHVESDTLRTIELQGIPRHLRLLEDPNFGSWTRVLFHEDRLPELPLKRLLGSRLVAESYSMPYHASMFP